MSKNKKDNCNQNQALAKELEIAMKQFESESKDEKARRNILSEKDNYAWLDDDDFMVTEEEMMS